MVQMQRDKPLTPFSFSGKQKNANWIPNRLNQSLPPKMNLLPVLSQDFLDIRFGVKKPKKYPPEPRTPYEAAARALNVASNTLTSTWQHYHSNRGDYHKALDALISQQYLQGQIERRLASDRRAIETARQNLRQAAYHVLYTYTGLSPQIREFPKQIEKYHEAWRVYLAVQETATAQERKDYQPPEPLEEKFFKLAELRVYPAYLNHRFDED